MQGGRSSRFCILCSSCAAIYKMRYAYLVAAGAVLAGTSVSMLTLVPKLTVSKSVVNMHIHVQLMYVFICTIVVLTSCYLASPLSWCSSGDAAAFAPSGVPSLRGFTALRMTTTQVRERQREKRSERVCERKVITCTAKAT